MQQNVACYNHKEVTFMSIAVNLDEKLVNDARSHSKVLSRSVTKQIEHWAKIGHIAEDNPNLL